MLLGCLSIIPNTCFHVCIDHLGYLSCELNVPSWSLRKATGAQLDGPASAAFTGSRACELGVEAEQQVREAGATGRGLTHPAAAQDCSQLYVKSSPLWLTDT